MNAVGTTLMTLAVCAVSGIVPFVNAELYLLGVAAVVPPAYAVPVVVAAALGQMIGKSVLFFAARGARALPSERFRRAVTTVEARYGDRKTLGAVLIAGSASIGLPPFYFIAIACGLLRTPFPLFFAVGLAGRLVRFGLIVLAPQVIRHLRPWDGWPTWPHR